jgi:excisionase family DNA binding protein
MPDARSEAISWLSTKEAAERLGVTLRSLYRFIDEGGLTAYKFGRVIRLKESDVETFIEASRIVPGSLEHLYPEVKGPTRMVHGMVDGSSVPSTHQPVAAEG